jgi:ketosteroid isomerase-like protein
MKKFTLIKLAIILLMTTTTLSLKAQKQPKVNAKKAVEEAVEKLRKLMVDPDSAGLSAMVSEKLTFGHSTGRVEDKATFLNAFLTGTSNFTSLDFTDQTVQVSGTTAIVRHTLTGAAHDKGKEPGTVKLFVLLVWQKVKGQWVLLARQAVKVPAAS